MRTLRLLAVVLAGTAVYARTFHVPFVFGDEAAIVRNLDIRELWPGPFRSAWPLVELSIALTYALAGLEPPAYHLGNLLAHLATALLLYDLARRTLLLKGVLPGREETVAFVAALLFVVHPIATNAVTYVSGRGEVLTALFYLLTLDLFLVGEMHARVRGVAWTAAVAASACGMATGSTMVTAPLAIVWLARCVCAWPSPLHIWFASEGEPVLRVPPARWPVVVGCALGWVLLAWLLATRDLRSGGLDFATAPDAYLRAQVGVGWHYARLLVWPRDLTLDYDWPLPQSWLGADVLGPALAWLAVAGVLVWLFRSGRTVPAFWLGLAVLAPFPSTSAIPLVDVASELRVYLASGAVAVLVALAAVGLVARRSRAVTAVAALVGLAAVVALGTATWRRNATWNDPVALWTDALSRAPTKARVFRNLRHAYEQRDDAAGVARVAAAEVRALELLDAKRPHDAELLTALGNAYARVGRPNDASTALAEAARLAPEDPVARAGYGALLLQLGRPMPAVAQLEMAEALTEGQPGWVASEVRLSILTNLGWAYASVNRMGDAVRVLREAAAGGDVSALNNLGSILARLGRWPEARDVLERAHRVEPTEPNVQSNLGWVYANLGQLADATRLLESAIRQQPDDTSAYASLGWVRLVAGDPAGAGLALTTAERLQPESAWVSHVLGIAQARLGDWDAAVASLQRARELAPDDATIRQNLDRAEHHDPLVLPGAPG